MRLALCLSTGQDKGLRFWCVRPVFLPLYLDLTILTSYRDIRRPSSPLAPPPLAST